MGATRAETRAKRLLRHEEMAIEFLGGKCVDCGESDRLLLEFHHTDPSLKTQNASKILNRSWDNIRIFLVAEKIQLLCKVCHWRISPLARRQSRS